MYIIFLLTIIIVSSILVFIETKKKELFVVIFSYKFKYVGLILVMVLFLLSFIKIVNIEPYYSIRILFSNLGLMIMVLSKDKEEFPNSNSTRLLCFVLSTLILYLGYHVKDIVFGTQTSIKLSQYVTNVLIIYLASYHYIKNKKSAKTV
ncbi:hypothetical protein D1614_19600 [Maribellus luteus]|uniref:Uncharacterized protein n=1 Tax=Maribellus luteus TaxID=2305463 RepID=A0A399STH6_9BACT|nr:hypothetical protein D1614_19600 [Maribellus luteus]